MAARGYWIGHVDVADADGYRRYVEANAAPFAKFGGRFLVRAGRYETLEGAVRSRQVVIEFADYETALACYRSPEYQAAKRLRDGVSIGDLVVAEGVEG
jgi:uncharacterized protein (DUF1330 family)